jgi:uncharacterized Tic20 family protein
MSTGPESPQPPDEPSRQPGEPFGQPPPQQPGYGQAPPPPPPPQQPPPGYGPPPAYGQQPGYPAGPRPMRPDEEKLWAIGAHLGPLVLGLIAPLVVWLVFKDRSQFLDRTGKEALNMQISYLIYFAVSGFSLLLLIGLVLLPVVGIAWLVLMIVATIKVSAFEDYRYPAIIRFIK